MRTIIVLLSVILSIPLFAQQKKVALIIGNGKYEGHFSTLHTPRNDAFAMGNILYKLGFETTVCYDLKRDSITYYLEEFSQKANDADVALFYFSGHAGIGDGEKYYLAPSGAYYSSAALTADCYPFETIENRLKRTSAPTKIYIIDACRNSIVGTKDIVRFTPQSLSKNIKKTSGTVYCFATDVKKTAETGDGSYSLFTESILSHIGETSDFNTVWKKISSDVTWANSEQRPIMEEYPRDITKKIYFNPNYINITDSNRIGLDNYNFITTPQDAKLMIDGKEHKIKERISLKYGKRYKIKISSEGYDTFEEDITASPHKRTYTISLRKLAEAKVRIDCDKENADVYFDGKYVGLTPLIVNSFAGKHDVRIEKNGYYDYYMNLVLGAGEQSINGELKKRHKWFWDFESDGLHKINYHFSQFTQIGLSYMFRPERSHFSYGLITGFSAGLFAPVTNPLSDEILIDLTGLNIGVNTDPNKKVEVEVIDGSSEHYSSFIDPYNEAKHYDESMLFLANFGYAPCNGIILEAGLGAGFHQDLYRMDNTYSIQRTITTNQLTGEVTKSPYEYKKQTPGKWYKENNKWSMALRAGIQFLIPIFDGDNVITLGSGYTYMPSINQYSDWDFNIGCGWYF